MSQLLWEPLSQFRKKCAYGLLGSRKFAIFLSGMGMGRDYHINNFKFLKYNQNISQWVLSESKIQSDQGPSGPKAWDLAVPEIFVPGLFQRYLSQSKASK